MFANNGFGRVTTSTTVAVSTEPPGPPPCTFQFSPSSLTPNAAGGSGTFTVSTAWGCETPATADVPWLSTTPLGYATRILADGPLAYWRLDTTDGTAIDSSNDQLLRLARDCRSGRSTPWADGRPAVTYDSAANAYTYIGYRWVFNPAGASFTLESWVRITQPTIGTIAGALCRGHGLPAGHERHARAVLRGL